MFCTPQDRDGGSAIGMALYMGRDIVHLGSVKGESRQRGPHLPFCPADVPAPGCLAQLRCHTPALWHRPAASCPVSVPKLGCTLPSQAPLRPWVRLNPHFFPPQDSSATPICTLHAVPCTHMHTALTSLQHPQLMTHPPIQPAPPAALHPRPAAGLSPKLPSLPDTASTPRHPQPMAEPSAQPTRSSINASAMRAPAPHTLVLLRTPSAVPAAMQMSSELNMGIERSCYVQSLLWKEKSDNCVQGPCYAKHRMGTMWGSSAPATWTRVPGPPRGHQREELLQPGPCGRCAHRAEILGFSPTGSLDSSWVLLATAHASHCNLRRGAWGMQSSHSDVPKAAPGDPMLPTPGEG